MLHKGLRFAAGLIVGALLWWYATPAYNDLLAFAARPLVHLDQRYAASRVTGVDREIRVTGRSIPSATVPEDAYTASVVLLFALFAMRPDLFRDHGMRAMILSLLLMVAMHVLSVVIGAEAIYAVRTPGWGDRHYSGVAQDLWQAAEFVYRIGAMFAVPFACYWVTSPQPAEARGNKSAPLKKRKRR